MLQGDHVAVAHGYQRRRGDLLDLSVGPAGKALVERPQPGEQVLQLVRIRRLGQIVVLHRGSGDHVDRHLSDRLRVLGPVPVGVERRRRHDQLADQLRVLDGQVQPHRAAHAEPEHVDPRNPQVLQQPHDVRRQVGAGQRTVDVAGASVSLKVCGDDVPRLRQGGQDLTELQVDVEQPPMQHQQRRPTRSVDLVIHLQPVHRRVSRLRRPALARRFVRLPRHCRLLVADVAGLHQRQPTDSSTLGRLVVSMCRRR
jgi:hypothetical protein